jgi:hypothetical protein
MPGGGNSRSPITLLRVFMFALVLLGLAVVRPVDARYVSPDPATVSIPQSFVGNPSLGVSNYGYNNIPYVGYVDYGTCSFAPDQTKISQGYSYYWRAFFYSRNGSIQGGEGNLTGYYSNQFDTNGAWVEGGVVYTINCQLWEYNSSHVETGYAVVQGEITAP